MVVGDDVHLRAGRDPAVAPAEPVNVSVGPVGFFRRGWNVARSALTERIGRPTRYWARSIQCVPMSATARRFVRPSASTRQL